MKIKNLLIISLFINIEAGPGISKVKPYTPYIGTTGTICFGTYSYYKKLENNNLKKEIEGYKNLNKSDNDRFKKIISENDKNIRDSYKKINYLEKENQLLEKENKSAISHFKKGFGIIYNPIKNCYMNAIKKIYNPFSCISKEINKDEKTK